MITIVYFPAGSGFFEIVRGTVDLACVREDQVMFFFACSHPKKSQEIEKVQFHSFLPDIGTFRRFLQYFTMTQVLSFLILGPNA